MINYYINVFKARKRIPMKSAVFSVSKLFAGGGDADCRAFTAEKQETLIKSHNSDVLNMNKF